ncbi:hypothetical protein H6P81_017292 [Aristolochia fimbriata]|uniref:Uncharacterized protein n=1 Tax=Aristolochia fimbriata TaxID=158543 RepID=A0AAV7E220_ARIFI|nr:hypothetical protein H6P81_017292 [Aristolochia fimbriata]
MRIRRHANLALSALMTPPELDLSTSEKKNGSSPSPPSHEEGTGFRSQSRRGHDRVRPRRDAIPLWGSWRGVDKKRSGEESNRDSVDLKGSSVEETTTSKEEEERGNVCESFRKNKIGFCGAKSMGVKEVEEEAKGVHSVCDHHAKQRRAHRDEPRRKASDRAAGIVDPGFVSQLPPSSDYYYYAGFAPLAGKRRRRRGISEAAEEAAPSSPSSGDDAPRDDDDREKKRGRKPMKSRSLKSLL